jgi:hypothetical protein
VFVNKMKAIVATQSHVVDEAGYGVSTKRHINSSTANWTDTDGYHIEQALSVPLQSSFALNDCDVRLG